MSQAGTVRNLVLHIFAVELFCQLASGLERDDSEKLPIDTVDEIFSITEKAIDDFAQFLEKATPRTGLKLVQLGSASAEAKQRKC